MKNSKIPNILKLNNFFLIQLKLLLTGAGVAGLLGPPVRMENVSEQESVTILHLDLGANHVQEQA